MKRLLVLSIMIFALMFSVVGFAAEGYEILDLDKEDVVNNIQGKEVVFKLMSLENKKKKVLLEDEAINYMKEKGLQLKVIMPKVTMTLSPEAFLVPEWDKAVKTGEPVKVRLVFKDGDLSKVAENFDAWYYGQIGMYRYGSVAYDFTGEILVRDVDFFDMTNFAAPVELKINYEHQNNLTQAKEEYMGLYALNEGNGNSKWEYAGGRVDKDKKILTVNTLKLGLMTTISNQKKFADTIGHWAENDIKLMAAKNVVQEAFNSNFYPNREITRGEFASFLVRTLNVPENLKGGKSFKDVTSDKWYYKEVITAANVGLVAGVSDTKFAPNEKITREQMAVMMTRALDYMGVSVKKDNKALEKFTDKGSVSDWAKDGAITAVSVGLINGRGSNSFAPKAFTSRAEAIVILSRLYKNI